MPTPEEEKIIICGAKINYETAEAIESCADAMLEVYELYIQTVKHSNDNNAEYFAEVREHALSIKKLAREIKEAASEFNQ